MRPCLGIKLLPFVVWVREKGYIKLLACTRYLDKPSTRHFSSGRINIRFPSEIVNRNYPFPFQVSHLTPSFFYVCNPFFIDIQ